MWRGERGASPGAELSWGTPVPSYGLHRQGIVLPQFLPTPGQSHGIAAEGLEGLSF